MSRKEKKLKEFNNLIIRNNLIFKEAKELKIEFKKVKQQQEEKFIKKVIYKNFPNIPPNVNVKVSNNFSRVDFAFSSFHFLSILLINEKNDSSLNRSFKDYKILIQKTHSPDQLPLECLALIGSVGKFFQKGFQKYLNSTYQFLEKYDKIYLKETTKINNFGKKYGQYQAKITKFLVNEFYFLAKNNGIEFTENIPCFVGDSHVNNIRKILIKKCTLPSNTTNGYFEVKYITEDNKEYLHTKKGDIKEYLTFCIRYWDKTKNFPYKL